MVMAKEFIRQIKGRNYRYLIYWDKEAKKPRQKYLGRVTEERKEIIVKTPDAKEVAEIIVKIGSGLIERKQTEKWIKRFKFPENIALLKNLFIEEK